MNWLKSGLAAGATLLALAPAALAADYSFKFQSSDPAGNPNNYVGLGVPFNGYCPCTEIDGGIEPTAIGRVPGGLGTRTYLWHYADGISVVVNLNSNEMTDPAAGEALTNAIHDLAAAAR